jgi:hypothetical protein
MTTTSPAVRTPSRLTALSKNSIRSSADVDRGTAFQYTGCVPVLIDVRAFTDQR